MSDYAGASGIVQFDPTTRDVNGKTVTEVVIRAQSQKIVRITVWPEHGQPTIRKGDFVSADGKFSTNAGTNKQGQAVTYNNLSAHSLVVVPQVSKSDRPVESSSSPAAASEAAPF